MIKINLIQKLEEKFPKGLSYYDAVELCLACYCYTDWFPDVIIDDLSKDNIALTFSLLSERGIIHTDNVGDPVATDKEHWIKVIKDALISGIFYNKEKINNLLQ